MKKFVLFIGIAFSLANLSSAYADRRVKAEELPSDAKTFLNVYFAESQIENVIQEDLTNDYEVLTEDGKEFDFDSEGRWKAVNCHSECVPSPLIPREILNQVAKAYGPTTQIVWIQRKSRGYKVLLSNGVEAKFNKRLKMVPVKQNL